jgi:hypothetical protein
MVPAIRCSIRVPAHTGNRKAERGIEMTYDQACDQIVRMAKREGYVAINIGYNGRIRGSGRYTASGVYEGKRVLFASAGSYVNMLAEAKQWLNSPFAED